MISFCAISSGVVADMAAEEEVGDSGEEIVSPCRGAVIAMIGDESKFACRLNGICLVWGNWRKVNNPVELGENAESRTPHTETPISFTRKCQI